MSTGDGESLQRTLDDLFRNGKVTSFSCMNRFPGPMAADPIKCPFVGTTPPTGQPPKMTLTGLLLLPPFLPPSLQRDQMEVKLRCPAGGLGVEQTAQRSCRGTGPHISTQRHQGTVTLPGCKRERKGWRELSLSTCHMPSALTSLPPAPLSSPLGSARPLEGIASISSTYNRVFPFFSPSCLASTFFTTAKLQIKE